ncbi:interleukin 15, like isoform X2 [Cololabis saira]|uniref:interleukin 15, like isoform X2 n=1 Tax=Cololabis saira TaxID=129043 RepID=UPI002AD59214|nr:interleukin 15, like isoform X2 [Cololabis saira]
MLSALGRVFLCSLGLLAAMATKPCSRDIITRVESLNATVQMYSDCRLYTPTIQDYKKCPKAALTCFASEVKVLTQELEILGRAEKSRRKNINSELKRLAQMFNQEESECRLCEVLQEENAPRFLENLFLSLEMMNRQHCRTVRRRRLGA